MLTPVANQREYAALTPELAWGIEGYDDWTVSFSHGIERLPDDCIYPIAVWRQWPFQHALPPKMEVNVAFRRILDRLSEQITLVSQRVEANESFADGVNYYRRNLRSLLSKYRGKYIAVLNRTVVDSDSDFASLAKRVFQRYGCRDIFMPKVTEKLRVVNIPSPRIANE